MPHDAKRAERVETERFKRLAIDTSANVARQDAGFAQSELRGRRAGGAGISVGDSRAIAHRPQPCLARHGEGAVHFHRAALVDCNGQSFDERIGRCAGRPDQGLCANLFRWIQYHHAWPRIGQARFEFKSHAALIHSLDVTLTQRFSKSICVTLPRTTWVRRKLARKGALMCVGSKLLPATSASI